MAKDYPNLVKKDVVAEIKPYLGKKQVSAEGTVEAIKQLRADSSAGYNSPDPAISAMAKAKGKIANELEGLMLRSTQKTNPDLVPELRAARTRIAKTYQIQKALKGENVDAVVLGEALKRGKPMDGLMRDVAEFGLNFPKAAQAKVPQYTSFRPMDYVAGIGGAMVDPVYATALFARPAIRFTIMSKPYQNMLARQAPARMAAIKKLPVEARGAAMVSLLDEIQSQGNSDSK